MRAAYNTEDIEVIDGEAVESSLPGEALPSERGRPQQNPPTRLGEEQGLQLYADKKGNVYKETPRARRAFDDYMAMGRSRSLPKLAEHYAANDIEWTDNYESVLRILKGYSAKFDWQNRIRIQLAADTGRIAAKTRRDALESSKERLRLYKKAQHLAEYVFDKALSVELEDLSAEEARKLLRTAVDMMKLGLSGERAEHGVALERVSLAKPIDQYTDEELDEFIKQLQGD